MRLYRALARLVRRPSYDPLAQAMVVAHIASRISCALVHLPEDPCCICGTPLHEGYDTRPAYLVERLAIARRVIADAH